MSNVNSTIILSLVSLTIIVLFLNLKERFTNIKDDSPQNDNAGFLTEDISSIEQVETLPDELQEEVEDMVDEILNGFNKQYNKKLIRVSIERVKKTLEENKNRYQVYVFVFNYEKQSSAKVFLEFSLDSNNFISVNKVEVVGSRESLVAQRGGASSRDTLNLKNPVDMDKVSGVSEQPLEFSQFNVAETTNKMVDRNKWILNKEREIVGDRAIFPSREIEHEWDMNGVNFVKSMNKEDPGGINYAYSKPVLEPEFYKQNFEICVGDYLWLFEKEADVASKPLGVG